MELFVTCHTWDVLVNGVALFIRAFANIRLTVWSPLRACDPGGGSHRCFTSSQKSRRARNQRSPRFWHPLLRCMAGCECYDGNEISAEDETVLIWRAKEMNMFGRVLNKTCLGVSHFVFWVKCVGERVSKVSKWLFLSAPSTGDGRYLWGVTNQISKKTISTSTEKCMLLLTYIFGTYSTCHMRFYIYHEILDWIAAVVHDNIYGSICWDPRGCMRQLQYIISRACWQSHHWRCSLDKTDFGNCENCSNSIVSSVRIWIAGYCAKIVGCASSFTGLSRGNIRIF